MRVPWTARRSNQSILKEISPGCSVEGLMLKLKLQYFVHLMWRTDSLEKSLMLGKIEGRRRGLDREWDSWMASLAWWTWVWTSSKSWWWTGIPGVLQSMSLKESDMTGWLNWTDYINTLLIYLVHTLPSLNVNPMTVVGFVCLLTVRTQRSACEFVKAQCFTHEWINTMSAKFSDKGKK